MKSALKIVPIVAVAFCLCGFFTLFLPQHTQCSLESLILLDNSMPARWSESGQVLSPVLPKHGAQDVVGLVYENGSEIAQDKIYRYKNAVLAFLFFRGNNQLFFPSGLWKWSDLVESEDWELKSDEFKIKCGNSDDSLLGYLCVAVVRHGPYISEFSSPVKEGIMSLEEFKAVVLTIDTQIASCIQQPKK